ncbi:MAG: VOC family protein [Maricaulaceae bacterium]
MMKAEDITAIPELPAAFGPARQVAYIVPDIDAAMAHWKTLGVAAFLVTRDVIPLQNAFYRGEKSGKTPVNIAFGYMGDMQIELIQALDDTPSIYTEAVTRGITGVHHYAVCVENFPAQYNYALDHGYEAVVDSGIDGLARMSYIENVEAGIILEMIEWNDLTRPYFDAIREMWDAAAATGENAEFDLAALTPKGAILKSLGGFLVKKLTGRIKPTRRTA